MLATSSFNSSVMLNSFKSGLSLKTRFKCNNCNYSAIVQGGPGTTLNGNYQTCKCNDCKHIVDLKVWERKPMNGVARIEQFEPCTNCDSKNVVAWFSEDCECPRCSEKEFYTADQSFFNRAV